MFNNFSTRTNILLGVTAAGVIATAVSLIKDRRDCTCCCEDCCEAIEEELVDPTVDVAL